MKALLIIKSRLIVLTIVMGNMWCTSTLVAQTKDTIERERQVDGTVERSPMAEDTSERYHTAVEVMPEPAGGMMAFMQWVGRNYQYPKKAVDAAVQGTVEVSFVVEKDGSLTNFKIRRDLGYGTGQEAVKVLQKAPKWKPGIQNGKPVRVMFTMPIRLSVTG